MKLIYKLTPWILLAIIVVVLVISFFMYKTTNVEGFGTTTKLDQYYDVEVKQLHDNIYFDEANGTLIIDNNTDVSIMERHGNASILHGQTRNTLNAYKDTLDSTDGISLNYTILDSQETVVDQVPASDPIEDSEPVEPAAEPAAEPASDENFELMEGIDGNDNSKPKYEIFYNALGKNTSIYIFGYEYNNENNQSIKLINSSSFTVDPTDCKPDTTNPNVQESCNKYNDDCPSGRGYIDSNDGTNKCCNCTPQFIAVDKGGFNDIDTTSLTAVQETNKLTSTTGVTVLTQYDNDIKLDRLIENTLAFDKEMGNLVLLNNAETAPSVLNYKKEEVKNAVKLTKLDNLQSWYTIHNNALILFSYYMNYINITVLQLVEKTNTDNKLEKIVSRNYIVAQPLNKIEDAVKEMTYDPSVPDGNVPGHTHKQSVGDKIYDRILTKVGDLIDKEIDHIINPDETTDDRYILKTQVVPPVCPTCPNCVNNCKGGGVCTDCGGSGGSGTRSENGKTLAEENKTKKNAISQVVDETGNVITNTIDTTGKVIKDTATTAVDIADSTIGGVTRDVYSGTKGAVGDVYGASKDVAGEVYGTTKDIAGDVYGTTTGVVGDLYSGAKSLTSDIYGGITNLGTGPTQPGTTNPQVAGNTTGANIGVTQRTAYTDNGRQQPDVYNYYGALPEKQLNFIPLTSDFSAFGR